MMQSADIKPWEPVSWRWEDHAGFLYGKAFQNSEHPICRYMEFEQGKPTPWSAHVTLANGQTVIVRAKG